MSASVSRPHDVADPRRLAAVRASGLLDSPADEELDRLVDLVGELLGTTSAAISLLDADRQWFLARRGIPDQQTSLDRSLCAITIAQPDGLLVVTDAQLDPRTARHDAIAGASGVRCYAGAALETPSGERIGALCVFDRERREFTPAQLALLRVLAREVTARFTLHRELERRKLVEQRLAELGTWELEIESASLWCSEEALRQIGLDPAHFDGTLTALLSAVHPDDRASVQAALDHACADLVAMDVLHRVRRSDGVERLARLRAEPVRDGGGRPIRLVGTLQDVTDRTMADTRLRESEQRWRELFAGAPRPMWVYDIATLRFLEVNTAACATYGWSRDEFLAMDITAIRPVEDRARVVEAASDATAAFKRSGPWRHLWKDGTLREVEITSHELHWNDRPARLVLVDDVTERRLAERTMAALTEQLREQVELLDLATDAILVQDLDGRVRYWNGGAVRLFGWSVADAVGQPVAELLGSAETAQALGLAAVVAGGVWRGDVRGRTRTGAELQLVASCTLVRAADAGPRAVLAILSDVTAARRLESQVLRAQRLDGIGTLAGGIAHDLNNMLAPILMAMPLLQMEVATEDGRELLQTVEASARRGSDLVRQILAFARGGEGRHVPVAIADVAADVVRLLRDTLPRQVRLEVAVAADLPPVAGDPTQLHQVLLNLCVNARDAMPDGGTLRIAAHVTRLDPALAQLVPAVAATDYVCLVVTDTGTGIPAEHLERIFDPFFTTKPIGKGTGLGLATVHAIARAHGGFVRVESEPSTGTTFRVYLPGTSDAERARTAVRLSDELPRGAGEVVLVVDDDAAIRAITGQTLEAHGYRVLLAADGAAALALHEVHGDAIAAVLTDMMMPRLDGPALIRELRARDARVPIIATSGLGAYAGPAQAASLGVARFLPKPFTASALLQALAEVVRRS